MAGGLHAVHDGSLGPWAQTQSTSHGERPALASACDMESTSPEPGSVPGRVHAACRSPGSPGRASPPGARACSRFSSTTKAAPSARIPPFRSRSNGRLAFCGRAVPSGHHARGAEAGHGQRGDRRVRAARDRQLGLAGRGSARRPWRSRPARPGRPWRMVATWVRTPRILGEGARDGVRLAGAYNVGG